MSVSKDGIMNEDSYRQQYQQLPDVTDDVVQAIIDLVSDGIWDWHIDTGYVYRNSGWYRMLGYEPHSLDNDVLTWESLIHPEDLTRVMLHFDDYLSGRSSCYRIEYRCRTSGGDYLWIEDCAHIVTRLPDGAPARMIGAHRDIHDKKLYFETLVSTNQSLALLVDECTQELRHTNEELHRQVEENRRLAETDSLTQVANRYRLEQTLRHECERAKRFNHALSIVTLDIDEFKQINDLYGHCAGDQTLVELANQVKHQLREIDTLARWGGDEFILILPSTSLQDAHRVAEKIRAHIAEVGLQTPLPITLSFGLAEYLPGEGSHQLLNRADGALYRAKRLGKNLISE
jgi:diguanylate cyclase (GGDEF)-like protein/PAS domain S-box-containing protein